MVAHQDWDYATVLSKLKENLDRLGRPDIPPGTRRGHPTQNPPSVGAFSFRALMEFEIAEQNAFIFVFGEYISVQEAFFISRKQFATVFIAITRI